MTSAATPHFTNFGRYEIVRKLGRSMSDVYLARDPAISRPVVLKIVEHCDGGSTQMIAEAERRGAAIQQQLHAIDPRVLEIYDVGEQNGTFYIAMQYAEGRSVAELLADQVRLEIRQAAGIAAEICSQLASLHSFEAEIDGRKRSVVHGDIKPSNIQIGPDGEVRLLDFGIAKAISATRKLTHHDLGSPAYCSPERLNSSQVDLHSDLWAVGVCLYEMVAGLPPYQAQTTRKLENVIQSRRPPRALPADCPRGLRVIIQKALAADPERRYATAQDFEKDLRSFLAKEKPVAENDSTLRWQANATVEKPRTAIPAPAVLRQHWPQVLGTLRSARGSLIVGVLTGLFVFVPAVHTYRFWMDSAPLREGRDYSQAGDAVLDQDMRLLAEVQQDYQWLQRLSPAVFLRERLRARLVAVADKQFAAYRTHADSTLDMFEWARVRGWLERALLLSGTDAAVRGRLALAEGYEHLRNGSGQPEEVHRTLLRAASLLATWPDPRLALARFYIYRQKNLGRAVAEWHTAEKLGFRLGPREWEQEGEGYLGRAEAALRDLRRAGTPLEQSRIQAMLQRDAMRVRQRLEPIAGFGRVTNTLERLEQVELQAAALEARSAQAPRQAARRYSRNRPWR